MPDDGGDMAIEPEAKGSGDVLTIEGAMTVQRAGEIKTLLADALARSDRVVIGLGGVTEVDLCGLQLLCSVQRTAAQARKSVALAGPLPGVFGRAAAEAGVCVRSDCGADDAARCPWKGGAER